VLLFEKAHAILECAQSCPDDYWKSPAVKYFLAEKTGIREEPVSPTEGSTCLADNNGERLKSI
jgi:hypothetical protein